MEKQDKSVNCNLCNSTDTSFISDYRNKSFYFSKLKLYVCNSCLLVFAFPKMKNEILDKYNSEYHLNAHNGHDRDYKLQAFFSGISKLRISTILENTNLDPNQNLNVLEIGPGPGFFAKEWLKLFKKSNYSVIETDKNLHDDLKKNNINIITNYNSKLNKSFDVIILSHVLEHVTDPIRFLNHYTKKLKKGGIIFIEVPCNDWKHKKLDEPHLLFFNKESISMLSKSLNLEIIKNAYFGSTIDQLNSLNKKICSRLRSFFWSKGISLYHPERKNLKNTILSNLEIEALLNFDAHIEQTKPSWWLRVILKK